MSSAPTSSPGSLALVVSNLEGQFTEVSRKKRKIVEKRSGLLGDGERGGIFLIVLISFSRVPKLP